jgi:hypothetical protein
MMNMLEGLPDCCRCTLYLDRKSLVDKYSTARMPVPTHTLSCEQQKAHMGALWVFQAGGQPQERIREQKGCLSCSAAAS